MKSLDTKPPERRKAHDDGTQTSLFQTAINFMNLLLGVFVLTMPFALKLGGVVIAYVTLAYNTFAMACSTNFLTRIIIDHPSVRTYGDVAELAFGRIGKALIRSFLMMELILCGASIILIASETTTVLAPLISKTMYAVLFWICQFPFTIFSDRLSWLSWFSASGMLGVFVLFAVLVQVGTSPVRTNSTITAEDQLDSDVSHHGGELLNLQSSLQDLRIVNGGDVLQVFYCIAIVSSQMAGISVWPSMMVAINARDRTYNKVSFLTTLVIVLDGLVVAVIGFLGYAIFRLDTTSIIMFDLLSAEKVHDLYAFGATLCAMIALNALSKYGLCMNPVMVAAEAIMHFFIRSTCCRHLPLYVNDGNHHDGKVGGDEDEDEDDYIEDLNDYENVDGEFVSHGNRYRGGEVIASEKIQPRPHQVGFQDDMKRTNDERDDEGKHITNACRVADIVGSGTGEMQRTASSLSSCSSSSSLKPEVIMTMEADNDDNDDKDMMTDERATSPSDKNRAYHHAIDGKKEGQFQAQKKKKKKLMMRNFEEGVVTIQLAPRQPNDTVIILEERKVETSNVNSSWTSSGSTIFRRIASGIMVQVVVLLVVLLVPEFALVSALVGAALSTPLCILWPAACYVKLYWGTSTSFFRVFLVVFLALATVVVVVGVVGTVSQFGTIQFLQ